MFVSKNDIKNFFRAKTRKLVNRFFLLDHSADVSFDFAQNKIYLISWKFKKKLV